MIRYVDLVNGNDANDGTTFALRKKTIQSVTGLTAGDTIRVMKSPDPTSLGSCTWSNSTRTVILPQAATAHINPCDTNWTVSANVTSTLSGTTGLVRFGSLSVQLSIATAFTTGKVAYAPCSTTDLSAFQQISLFLANNAAITANTIYIDLCSDATGDVPVVSFALPAKNAATTYVSPFTFNNGSALPNNIQSIAIRCVSDPGAITLTLDHIIASKAPTVADSLTLNSIIGLNTTAEPEWYSIRSIDGTTVTLDIYNVGWTGSSGSLTTYKLEPIRLQDVISTALPTGRNTTPVSGWSQGSNGNSAQGYLNIEFGWDDVDMSTQTGMTAFDFQVFSGYGVPAGEELNINNFISIRAFSVFSRVVNESIKFGTYHSVNPVTVSFTENNTNCVVRGDNVYITSYISVGSSGGACSFYINNLSIKHTSSFENTSLPRIPLTGNQSYYKNIKIYAGSIQFQSIIDCNIGYLEMVQSNYSSSPAIVGVNASNINIKTLNIFAIGSDYSVYINCVSTTGNFKCLVDKIISPNTLMTSKIDVTSTGNNNFVFIRNNNDIEYGLGFSEIGTLRSTTTNTRLGTGVAWEMRVSNGNRYFPVIETDWYKRQNFKIAQLPVKANKLCTVKIWTKRLFASTAGALFVNPYYSGINDYVVATSNAAANVWEELTITFTPTDNNVIDLYVGGQYDSVNATQRFYFDDLTFTQAD